MEEKKSRSQVVTILKALSRNRMAVLGLVILIILLFTGIFAHVITGEDMDKLLPYCRKRILFRGNGSAL